MNTLFCLKFGHVWELVCWATGQRYEHCKRCHVTRTRQQVAA